MTLPAHITTVVCGTQIHSHVIVTVRRRAVRIGSLSDFSENYVLISECCPGSSAPIRWRVVGAYSPTSIWACTNSGLQKHWPVKLFIKLERLVIGLAQGLQRGQTIGCRKCDSRLQTEKQKNKNEISQTDLQTKHKNENQKANSTSPNRRTAAEHRRASRHSNAHVHQQPCSTPGCRWVRTCSRHGRPHCDPSFPR